jgi:formylmethanofuran dehydrogenase subunit B
VHVPGGRRSRTVIAVDVGASRGASDADHRVTLSPGDEVSALTLLRAASLGRPLTAVADGDPGAGRRMHVWQAIAPLLEAVRAARYVVVVADAEPDTATPDRDPGRASALIGWTQALHETTRAALITLRAGGNRSGADAWLTAQTGYPMAVDFSRGYPQYRPHDAAAARLDRGEIDAAVVTGAAGYLPGDTLGPLHRIPVIAIGPRASEGPLGDAHVVIDTGIAGIHEGGTALRMDDVPLPIAAALPGAPAAAAVLRDLRARVGSSSK